MTRNNNIKKKCLYCDKSFRVHFFRTDDKNLYCSKDCRIKAINIYNHFRKSWNEDKQSEKSEYLGYGIFLSLIAFVSMAIWTEIIKIGRAHV